MKKGVFFFCATLLGATLAHAAPPDAGDPDWSGVRRDVDAEARRPGDKGDFAMRRQAIRERARARYREADANGDGQLSREEMTRLRPGLAKHFDRIDANGDGLASEQETLGAVRKHPQRRGDDSGR